MNKMFSEDRYQALYAEGVAARARNEPKCPYVHGSGSAYYWTRGYSDGANPPPEGMMRTTADYTARADMSLPNQQLPQLTVRDGGGLPLIRMAFMDQGALLTTEEVDDFGRYVEKLLAEKPFEMKSRVFFRGKEFLAAKHSTPDDTPGATRTRTARIVDGVVRVPAGAAIGPDGEIVVPSRQLDSSSPTAKSFRRACRAARNAIRELAEKESRPVSVITKEMMEKSA